MPRPVADPLVTSDTLQDAAAVMAVTVATRQPTDGADRRPSRRADAGVVVTVERRRQTVTGRDLYEKVNHASQGSSHKFGEVKPPPRFAKINLKNNRKIIRVLLIHVSMHS